MGSVKHTGVRPSERKRQQRFLRPNGLVMAEPDITNSPVEYLPGVRLSHARLVLGLQAMQDCSLQKGKGPSPASATGRAAVREGL